MKKKERKKKTSSNFRTNCVFVSQAWHCSNSEESRWLICYWNILTFGKYVICCLLKVRYDVHAKRFSIEATVMAQTQTSSCWKYCLSARLLDLGRVWLGNWVHCCFLSFNANFANAKCKVGTVYQPQSSLSNHRKTVQIKIYMITTNIFRFRFFFLSPSQTNHAVKM